MLKSLQPNPTLHVKCLEEIRDARAISKPNKVCIQQENSQHQLNREKFKAITLKSVKAVHSMYLFSTVFKVLAREIRQLKEIITSSPYYYCYFVMLADRSLA